MPLRLGARRHGCAPGSTRAPTLEQEWVEFAEKVVSRPICRQSAKIEFVARPSPAVHHQVRLLLDANMRNFSELKDPNLVTQKSPKHREGYPFGFQN
jgi:hypothetical protein